MSFTLILFVKNRDLILKLRLGVGKGVLALPAGLTVLRFLPPLVVEQSDLEQVVAAVREVLSQEKAE